MALELISRLVLSAVFLAAALLKLADPAGMYEAVLSYKLVGGTLALVAAYFIPALEFWAALGLWWRPLRAASALAIAGLLLLFLAVIALSAARGLSFDCGCFGNAGEAEDWRLLVLRDAGLLLLALYVLKLALFENSLKRGPRYASHALR